MDISTEYWLLLHHVSIIHDVILFLKKGIEKNKIKVKYGVLDGNK